MPLTLRIGLLTVLLASLLLLYYQRPQNPTSESLAELLHSGYTGFKDSKLPDFGQYVALNTLSRKEFPLGDPSRRVIVVGDIHGMDKYLQKLLHDVEYDSSSDVLVHVGDIAAKGTHEGSMSVISFMTRNNITGVRGNHDQKIIEWRAWLEWVHSLPGGRDFLESMHSNWTHASKKGWDLEDWLKRQTRHPNSGTRQWLKRIPDGWVLFGDHYSIARDLSAKEYEYLTNLPLRLHIPSAHTFIAHAGMLPEDIRYRKTDKRQPLARAPVLPKALGTTQSKISAMRNIQETKILGISHNRDPFVVLNMRSIMKGRIVRGQDGHPWADLWNQDMSLCSGFSTAPSYSRKPTSLPCHPSTMLYGHSASRGLDVKRWSIGLDTGCVYGRKLTAVVLGRAARGSPKALGDDIANEFEWDEDMEDFLQVDGYSSEDEDEDHFEILGIDEDADHDHEPLAETRKRKKKGKSRIHYGDQGHGRLYHVKCR